MISLYLLEQQKLLRNLLVNFTSATLQQFSHMEKDFSLTSGFSHLVRSDLLRSDLVGPDSAGSVSTLQAASVPTVSLPVASLPVATLHSDRVPAEIEQQDRLQDNRAEKPLADYVAGDSLWAESLWSEVLTSLRAELDHQIYAAYLKPLRLKHLDKTSQCCILTAPSTFVRNHVEGNFGDRIARMLSLALSRQGLPHELTVKFLLAEKSLHAEGTQLDGEQGKDGQANAENNALNNVRPGSDPSSRTRVVKRLPVVVRQRSAGAGSANYYGSPEDSSSGIISKYTFDNFVVGSANQFCHAAASRVAEQPGQSYNPLFIYGGVGLGKTHLLHAIGNLAASRRPGIKVRYMSSETFTNELIQALRNAKMNEFKSRLRTVELLLIDDIQFMCGKERTQEEFFHTFNTLYNAKHQIVMTSDRLPQDIPGIEERLQTRFSWGLTADLQTPDFETRAAIIKRKSASSRCPLADDIVNFIASNVSSNIRELEGALTRLQAVASIKQVKMSLSLAEEALKPILYPKQGTVSVRDIQKAVSEECGIKISEMISKRRTKNLSFPRHIAMFLCRKHTTHSYPEIGAEFGNRDHSSVIHAAQVVGAKVNIDSKVRDLIEAIERRLHRLL